MSSGTIKPTNIEIFYPAIEMVKREVKVFLTDEQYRRLVASDLTSTELANLIEAALSERITGLDNYLKDGIASVTVLNREDGGNEQR